MINPRIVSAENTSVEFFEGCLSVAGYSVVVPRARGVTVEFLNEKSETRRVEAVGWYARILQHEIDYLRGVLYVDCMHAGTFTTLENLGRFWKELSVSEARAKLKTQVRT